MRKVLIHVDEMAKWPMVIKNVNNLLRGYQEKGISCQVEVVANGQGVLAYIKEGPKEEEALDALAKQGVTLAACNNALRGLKIQQEALMDFVTIVPSGVVELVEKQYEGYGYIKP